MGVQRADHPVVFYRRFSSFHVMDSKAFRERVLPPPQPRKLRENVQSGLRTRRVSRCLRRVGPAVCPYRGGNSSTGHPRRERLFGRPRLQVSSPRICVVAPSGRSVNSQTVTLKMYLAWVPRRAGDDARRSRYALPGKVWLCIKRTDKIPRQLGFELPMET